MSSVVHLIRVLVASEPLLGVTGLGYPDQLVAIEAIAAIEETGA